MVLMCEGQVRHLLSIEGTNHGVLTAVCYWGEWVCHKCPGKSICFVNNSRAELGEREQGLVYFAEVIEALWWYMVLGILVYIGLGNGLVPEGTKPLPKPMLAYQ